MKACVAIRSSWLCLLCIVAPLCVPSPSLASPYKITVLDSPSPTYAAQLNNLGQVSGVFTSPGDPGSGATYSYFYDSNPGGKVVLGGITSPSGSDPGSYDYTSRIISLNDKGQALGVAKGLGTVSFDVKTGQATPIGPIPASNFTPERIAESGAIYGHLNPDPTQGLNNHHSAVYQNGVLQDLGSPSGQTGWAPTAVNDAGQFLVRAGAHGDQTYVLNNGTWTHLGNFYGQAINERGDVVGSSTGDQPHTMLVPHGTTTPVDLGTLAGQTTSMPMSINDRGEIVGVAFTENRSDLYRAFLYRDGAMTDLNTLIDATSGWTIRMGMSINDRGQILAYADRDGGSQQTILLTPDGLPTPPDFIFPEMPVPEPSTFIVFGVIAAGFAWRRSRS